MVLKNCTLISQKMRPSTWRRTCWTSMYFLTFQQFWRMPYLWNSASQENYHKYAGIENSIVVPTSTFFLLWGLSKNDLQVFFLRHEFEMRTSSACQANTEAVFAFKTAGNRHQANPNFSTELGWRTSTLEYPTSKTTWDWFRIAVETINASKDCVWIA